METTLTADTITDTGYRIDPVSLGREDCDDAVNNGADPATIVAPGQLGADEALINAMNRAWVLVAAAGGDPTADADDEWERVGVPWCLAYNEAFRARAQELLEGAGVEDVD